MLESDRNKPQKYVALINLLVEGGGDLRGFDYIGWIREQIDKVPVLQLPVHHFWHHVQPDPQVQAAKARAEFEKQKKEFSHKILQISKYDLSL